MTCDICVRFARYLYSTECSWITCTITPSRLDIISRRFCCLKQQWASHYDAAGSSVICDHLLHFSNKENQFLVYPFLVSVCQFWKHCESQKNDSKYVLTFKLLSMPNWVLVVQSANSGGKSKRSKEAMKTKKKTKFNILSPLKIKRSLNLMAIIGITKVLKEGSGLKILVI